MEAVDLVIFDCDGVLIDSERLGVKVDVIALRELGWPLSETEVIARFVGRSDRENRAAIEDHLGRKLPDGWGDEVDERVLVEDSRPGVEAARAAGMGVLAFAGGLTPAELLDGPDTIVFYDMRDLPSILDRVT